MSEKHTPTPWAISPPDMERQCPPIIHMAGDPEFTIATPTFEWHNPTQQQQDMANTEFIVRAVNAHDELVAALGGLIDFIDELGGDEADMPRYKAATAALTKATESK